MYQNITKLSQPRGPSVLIHSPPDTNDSEPRKRSVFCQLDPMCTVAPHMPTNCAPEFPNGPGSPDHGPARAGDNRHEPNSSSSGSLSSKTKCDNSHIVLSATRTYNPSISESIIKTLQSQSYYRFEFTSIKGTNNSDTRRPTSILWPSNYEDMASEIAKLDAYIQTNKILEKPVEWMIHAGLIRVPKCTICGSPVELIYEHSTARWHCSKSNHAAPIQRPTCFQGFEHVGLKKLLFLIYYWAVGSTSEAIRDKLNLDSKLIQSIWNKIQKVCRTALEKSYPKFRLCNDHENNSSDELIDLLTIVINGNQIVCAKHPHSNKVRLGLSTPGSSSSSLVNLTENWFAHGVKIRVCEKEFLELKEKLRTDLQIELVKPLDMVTSDDQLRVDWAFGYILNQLANVFRDSNSRQATMKMIKLSLAEMQWREEYGTNPIDSFTRIVDHMREYFQSDQSKFYLFSDNMMRNLRSGSNAYSKTATPQLYAEKYYYATVEPIDDKGEIIRHYNCDSTNGDSSVVEFRCHICDHKFENFMFSMHIIAHVESESSSESGTRGSQSDQEINCKHCFKYFPLEELATHADLIKSELQKIKFSCKICCIKLQDRSTFLDHMKKHHFKHATPYRCPSCPFASSFQRDVFVHFQEEHRSGYILLCPICLRSFTICEPHKLDEYRYSSVSTIFYKHIKQHYMIKGSMSCDSCSLCFLGEKNLRKHKSICHDPGEVRSESEVCLQAFIITEEEEKYCVPVSLDELEPFDSSSSRNAMKQIEPASRSDDIPAQPNSNGLPDVVKPLDGIRGRFTCVDCSQLVTADHYAPLYRCSTCSLVTNCKVLIARHQSTKHQKIRQSPIER